jgi:hypothetical protein
VIVIHIGLKKSGSGSIQTFFSANVRRLRKLSLVYPRIGRPKIAHHNFAYELRGLKRFDPSEGSLSECAKRWGDSPHRVMLLSSEMFEEVERHRAMEMKVKFLVARPSEDFQIYFVVRDLVDLMPSSYAQKIKHGFHDFDFDAFFAGRMKTRRVHYFGTAERWADAFGWSSLQVRVLDPMHLFNKDLIDDLLAVCGVTHQEDKAGLKPTGIQNAAPGWRVIEATRALYNGLDGLRPTHPLKRRIECNRGDKNFRMRLGSCAEEAGDIRGWNADRGLYLTREQAQQCYEAYRETVSRLNEKLPQKLPPPADLQTRAFRERQFLPGASHIPPNELSAFYDDIWDLFQKNLRGAKASPA